MIIAACSFILWSFYGSFDGTTARASYIPTDAYSTLATCQREADDRAKVTKQTKGLIITYTCLPDTIDPRK